MHTSTCIHCNTISHNDLCLHTFLGVICAKLSIISWRGRSTASSKINVKANLQIAWQYVIAMQKACAAIVLGIMRLNEKQ